MAAVIGSLRADLSASVAQFEDDMGKAAKAVEAFGKRAASASQGLMDVGAKMSLAITAPFIALSFRALQGAKDAANASGQVQAVLTSMGGASGKTLEELQALALELRGLSTYDDDDILTKSTANLLTFGNVAGATFDRASKAILDVSARLGYDLQASTMLVGKALNDPIRGLTQLRRVGIQFTDEQAKMVEGFVKANRIVDAQAVLLGELEKQFGGAAKAARDADAFANLRDIWRDIEGVLERIATQFLPPVIKAVERLGQAFLSLNPETQTFIVGVVAAAAALGPLVVGLGAVVGAVANLAPMWAGLVTLFADAAATAGIANLGLALRAFVGYIAPFAGAILFVVGAFWEFRGAFVEAFGQVVAYFQQTALPAFQQLWSALKDLFGNIDKLMDGPLGRLVGLVAWAVAEIGAIFLKGIGMGVSKAIGLFVGLLATALKAVSDLVEIVASLLSGDFAGAWEATKDLVTGEIGGILDALENFVPGITDAARAAYEAFLEFVGNGITAVIAHIRGQFPGLVEAVAAAAVGAVAWAKNLYEGIKTWISDNLGPVIAWARDRIRELNSLFAQIRNRQQQVRGGGSNAPAPSTPEPKPTKPEPKPTNAPPPSPSAGGGGGGGGGSARVGKTDSDKEAEKLQKATEKFREALADVQDNIDRSFDRNMLPRSMQAAKQMRDKIADLEAEAKAAGVSTGAFADEIAKLQLQIGELETKGLAKEAEDFARDVRDAAAAVQDLGGGLPPLDEKLRDLDDRYADLRTAIQDQITENAALAGANTEAAAAMAVLERQLAALDAAHAKATEAAKAQFAAEQRLSDLQSAAALDAAAKDIRDLRQARGDGGPMGGTGKALQDAQDALDAQRQQAAQELADLELRRLEAEKIGDQQALDNIAAQMAMQQQLYDLVSATSAEQIVNADRVKSAWDTFEQSASEGFAQLVTDWKGGLDSVKKSIANLIIQLLQAQAAKGISNIFSKFAGGFATGGTLAAGQWGIAGENGPEPIFAGATRMSVVSNEEAFGSGKGGFYIDARGAGPREVDELRRMFENLDRNFERRSVDATNKGLMRGKIAPPSFG